MGARKVSGSKKPKTTKAKRSAKTKLVRRRTVRISNPFGLHARPSALFVKKASEFPECTIRISDGVQTVNGRSIMGIITLAAGPGTKLALEITGPDADRAISVLAKLLAEKFDYEQGR